MDSAQQPYAAPWWRRLLARGARDDAGDPEVVFPPGFLESLERMRILALKASGGGLKEGHRLGAYKGGQLEFHDHRSYAPGDDLRYLDWNLYARLGRPFVKQFAREEAGAIHLLLDATPSMGLGAPCKWTFVRRLAALFAHVGWSARDSVRAYVFRGGAGEFTAYPPRGLRAATPDFLGWLRRERLAGPPEPQGAEAPGSGAPLPGGALLDATGRFLRAAPVRGRVFILSDYWQEEAEIGAAVQRLAASGFELSAVHVLAAEEALPPGLGEWRVLALEEPGEVELNATPEALARYGVELDAHLAAVAHAFRRHGGAHLFARSDSSLERVLVRTLRLRRWLS